MAILLVRKEIGQTYRCWLGSLYDPVSLFQTSHVFRHSDAAGVKAFSRDAAVLGDSMIYHPLLDPCLWAL
ncbi:MAG: hypothetical protein ACI9DF_004036 [Verrucomicrobiales bacterium]|jgi:hypothetical protein